MTSTLFKTRRDALYEQLKSSPYVIAAFDALQQTNDASAPFEQEANFWYLTGIEEPGWKLIVDRDGKSTLVAPDVSEVHRVFDGGLSSQEAQCISGVDIVLDKEKGDELLESLLQEEVCIGVIGDDSHEKYYSFRMNPAPKKLYALITKRAKEVVDIRPLLAAMRGVKSLDEIEQMRRAIDVTVRSFKEIKAKLGSSEGEYTLDAEFTYAFRSSKATHAYEPIIASGLNACTLHYQKNNADLPKNGLVLMDVGARMNGYCADITRTYAIGTPSDRERAVHAAVERAHHEIIAVLRPGLATKEYHEKVDEIMTRTLQSLNLLKTPDDYRKYFPHAISHGLGIDVHDSLGAPMVFKPGMVLTVEPGIYIPEEGIGVRIEDDILITEVGNENLSGSLSTAL